MPTTKQTRPTVSKPRRPSARHATARRPLTDSDVAMRAYQLFIERGGGHGRDVEDWLLAQRELLADR